MVWCWMAWRTWLVAPLQVVEAKQSLQKSRYASIPDHLQQEKHNLILESIHVILEPFSNHTRNLLAGWKIISYQFH